MRNGARVAEGMEKTEVTSSELGAKFLLRWGRESDWREGGNLRCLGCVRWRDRIARTSCAGRCLREGTASVTHVEGTLGQTHLYYVLRTRVNNAHRDVGGKRSLTITYTGLYRGQQRTSRCCRSCYLPGARCSGLHGTG